MKNRKKKKWSDFLWIAELGYLCLGFFNILFAWLGMLFFCIPLFIAIFGGSKASVSYTHLQQRLSMSNSIVREQLE